MRHKPPTKALQATNIRRITILCKPQNWGTALGEKRRQRLPYLFFSEKSQHSASGRRWCSAGGLLSGFPFSFFCLRPRAARRVTSLFPSVLGAFCAVSVPASPWIPAPSASRRSGGVRPPPQKKHLQSVRGSLILIRIISLVKEMIIWCRPDSTSKFHHIFV